MGGSAEWLSLAYWSELNILLGLVDICLVTSPTLGIASPDPEKLRAATRQTRRQAGLLWAIRQALIVAAVYVATSSAGTGGTLFWALAGSAAGLYLVSYLLLGQRLGDLEDDTGLGPTQPENLVYLLSYLSLINWALANPYRTGTGPKVTYALALLASVVTGAIIAGVLSIDDPLLEAWGCYPVSDTLDDLTHGMCPQSPLGSWRTCLSLPGSTTCETLRGNTLFIDGPYRVARLVATGSLAVYVASAGANYRRFRRI